VQGAFKYAGQICISVQRIYVHTDVFEDFLDRFLKIADGLVLGDPADEATDLGPVIDQHAADRIRSWVREAVEHGATVRLGAEAQDQAQAQGQFVPPTVLTDVPRTAKVLRAEIFGPVVIVTAVDDIEAAFDAVNDSDFGLQAGIFTADLATMWRAHARLEVGGVIVNDSPAYRVDHMPYGGVKDSGEGREGIRYAIEDMTEPRLLVIATPP
jgi:glyceraldehyde-3-phosphate dehydrogenase (NADP+)